MKHTRVRTDEFSTSGDLLRVTGRQGYEESTDVWVTREMGVKFEQNNTETIDPGFNVLGPADVNFPYRLKELTKVNITGAVDCKIKPGAICESLENVKVKPVGCTSFYDAFPKTQIKLLPYLVPGGTQERTAFLSTSVATFDTDTVSPPLYQWDPLVNNNFVIGYTAQATVANDNESVEEVGFVPRDYIQFGTVPDETDSAGFVPFAAAEEWKMPVSYDSSLDELSWNRATLPRNCIVRIDAHVFDNAVNVGVNYHFFLLRPADNVEAGNDSWSAKFDQNGIAGRVAEHGLTMPVFQVQPFVDRPADLEIAVPAYVNQNIVNALGAQQQLDDNDEKAEENFDNLVALHEELQEHNELVAAWARYDNYVANISAFQEAERVFGLKNARFYPQNDQTYRYSDTRLNEFWEIFLWSQADGAKLIANNNTPIPAAHNAAGQLRLFLRRPKFSKGNQSNWEANPALSRFFGWFDKEIDPQGPLVHRKFGSSILPTQFDQLLQDGMPTRDILLGQWAVVWSGLGDVGAGNTHRIARTYTFTLDAAFQQLYDSIDALGNVSNKRITFKFVTGEHVIKPAPAGFVAGVQPGVYQGPPVGGNRVFYIQFKRRHARCIGNRAIQLRRDVVFNGGVFQDALGNAVGKPSIISTATLHPDVNVPYTGWLLDYDSNAGGASPLVRPTARGTNPFDSDDTEVPNVFGEGSRPLFVTDGNLLENFTYHPKINPAAPDNVGPGDQLFLSLNNMFQGQVYTEVPRLENYSDVLQSRNISSVSLTEPFFGLDSGMSTHGVTKIFKPKVWHNILLQDFDYRFDQAQLTPRLLKPGDRTEYSMTRVVNYSQPNIADNYTLTHDIAFKGFFTMKEPSETKLTIRSRDGLDQRIKLLENMNNAYPLFKKYSVVVAGAASPEARISIYSERGVPDYLFIFAERNLASNTEFVPIGNPIVSGISFYGKANKNRPLSTYLNSKQEIWQATLRNAHHLCTAEDLYNVGGCLITREDLGTLERHDYRTSDPFDYSIRVALENELGGTVLQKNTRDLESISVNAYCIYEEGVALKGTAQNLSFSEEKPLL